MKKLLILMLLWCCTSLAEAQQSTDHYQRGVNAYESGEYELAANIWLIEAYEGSSDAQFNLGVMYIEGKGVEQDNEEAVFWFTKASKLGHPDAQYNLGYLLLEQEDQPEKVDEAIQWWKQSANSGFAPAQYNYARALYYGVGINKNLAEAKLWFDRAKEAGDTSAIRFLAKYGDTFQESIVSNEDSEGDTLVAEAPSQPESETNDSSDTVVATEPESASSTQSVEANSDAGSESGDTDSEGYAILSSTPTLAYSRFNIRAPVVELVPAKSLIRISSRIPGWLRVQIPGGYPAWIKIEATTRTGDLATLDSSATIFADPTDQSSNNTLGELDTGTKLLVLQQQGNWLRVQLPERVSAWIEDKQIKQLDESEETIGTLWQAQSISLRLERMAAHEEILVERPTPVSVNDQVSTNSDRSLSNQSASSLGEDGEMAEQSQLVDEGSTTQTTESPSAPESQVAEQSESANNGTRQVDTGTNFDNSAELTVDELIAQRQLSNNVGQTLQTNEDQDSKPAVDVDIHKIVSDSARLFSSPGSNSVPLFKISKGTLVDIVTSQTGWARVSVPGGLPVWLPKDQVRIEGSNAIAEVSRIRVRAQPADEPSVPVLGLVGNAMQMQILQFKDDWLRVLAPEWITAWVPLSDIEPFDQPAEQQQAWQRQQNNLLKRYAAVAEKAARQQAEKAKPKVVEITKPIAKPVVESKPVAEPVTKTVSVDTSETRVATEPPLEVASDNGAFFANDNEWIFAQSDDTYTLQLFSVQSRSDALRLYDSLKRPARLFSTMIRGQRWYFVLMGEFDSSADARQVRNQLPQWAQGATVRTFERLKSKRCAKISDLSDFESKGLSVFCS